MLKDDGAYDLSYLENHKNLNVLLTATRFYLEETGTEFYFKATLIPGGSLSIDIKLRDERSSKRSFLGGKRLYASMMKYFGEENILNIEGSWSGGDNFNTYMQALSVRGTNTADAAFATWSGKMAHSYGFTNAKLVSDIGIVSFDFFRPKD